jgi:hypothetical protein
MTDIIASVRQLVQDETVPYALSDDTIEDVLDRHSQHIIRHKLASVAPDFASGESQWVQALATDWEDRGDLLIKDASGTTHTRATNALANGTFKLNTATSQTLYLYDAYTYDVYSAASECAMLLISAIKDEYTFSTDEGNFSRSDRVDTLQTIHDTCMKKRRLYSLPMGE